RCWLELKLLSVACVSGVVLSSCGAAGTSHAESAGPRPNDEQLPAPPVAATRKPGSTPAPSASGPSLQSVDKARHAPAGEDKVASEEVPNLPEGTTVLHVGDSFAGALGLALNKRLREAGIQGVLKYRTASYIVEWAHQNELETYLAQYQPDLVLISLGANELEITEPE